MAMVVYLTINSTTKEVFVAERVTNMGSATLDPDTVSTYKCYMLKDYEESPSVEVQHRYGDSGWALLEKGLSALRYSENHAA